MSEMFDCCVNCQELSIIKAVFCLRPIQFLVHTSGCHSLFLAPSVVSEASMINVIVTSVLECAKSIAFARLLLQF